MSSTRSRTFAVIAGTLLFLSSCASSNAMLQGTALRATGPQTMGVLGFPHAQVGKTYRFAFPPLVNGTRTKLVIESVKLTQVPEGVSDQIPGLLRQRHHRIHPGQPGRAQIPARHDQDAQLRKQPITVKPHKRSDFYAMAEVHVTGRGKHHLGSYQITYSQKGKTYRQTLRCDFALDMKQPPG